MHARQRPEWLSRPDARRAARRDACAGAPGDGVRIRRRNRSQVICVQAGGDEVRGDPAMTRLGRRMIRGHLSRRLSAALALLVAVAVIVAIVLITQASSSPSPASASSQVSGATAVQRRNLVSTDTESGTLSYANAQTVYNRLSGTITWLPSIGQVIQPGQALFKVDNEPVVLMNGTTPAYRDLNGSDQAGPDILELNRDLVAMGYDSEGIIVDDV